MLTEVTRGRMTLERYVEWSSEAPARAWGLYPKKGALQVGSDADIVVWDPEVMRTISAQTHHMRVDYNLFEGTAVRGAPTGIWLRGTQVVEGRTFTGRAGFGSYLLRSPFAR